MWLRCSYTSRCGAEMFIHLSVVLKCLYTSRCATENCVLRVKTEMIIDSCTNRFRLGFEVKTKIVIDPYRELGLRRSSL